MFFKDIFVFKVETNARGSMLRYWPYSPERYHTVRDNGSYWPIRIVCDRNCFCWIHIVQVSIKSGIFKAKNLEEISFFETFPQILLMMTNWLIYLKSLYEWNCAENSRRGNRCGNKSHWSHQRVHLSSPILAFVRKLTICAVRTAGVSLNLSSNACAGQVGLGWGDQRTINKIQGHVNRAIRSCSALMLSCWVNFQSVHVPKLYDRFRQSLRCRFVCMRARRKPTSFYTVGK